jgi:HAE1 family hydrophobic/amphiphilic exporter-1/multidrug efflux pump
VRSARYPAGRVAGVAGQRARHPVSQLRVLNLVDELKRLPGIADVTIFGARDYSMRVWLNPGRWRALASPRRMLPTRCGRRMRSTLAGRIGTERAAGQSIVYT